MTNVELDVGLRTSAAIYLKNEVRRHWDGTLGKENRIYSEEEKRTFRSLLVPLLEAVLVDGSPPSITNSIDDCIRCVAHSDYPESWPDVLYIIVEVGGLK